MFTAIQLAHLEDLAYLKNKGVLTDAEFQARRKALLTGRAQPVNPGKPDRSNEVMLLVLAGMVLASALCPSPESPLNE